MLVNQSVATLHQVPIHIHVNPIIYSCNLNGYGVVLNYVNGYAFIYELLYEDCMHNLLYSCYCGTGAVTIFTPIVYAPVITLKGLK